MEQIRKYIFLLYVCIVCCFWGGMPFAFAQEGAKTPDIPFLFETEWLEVPTSLLPQNWQTSTNLETGKSFLLLFWLVPQGDYYTYAHSPSVARPVRVAPKPRGFDTPALTENTIQARVYYPAGMEEKDTYSQGLTVPLYKGRVPVFLLFDEKPEEVFTLGYSLLACTPVRCMPVKGQVEVFPPAPAGWQTATAEDLHTLEHFIAGSVPAMQEVKETTAGPNTSSTPGTAGTNIPAEAAFTQGLSGAATPEFSPRPFLQSLEVTGLGKALILGFLAGLILNAMPCVLPILLLKVSGLLVGIQEDKEKGLRNFRQHNIYFALGIVVWFGALALVLGLADMVWGQLFQNAGLVLAMLLLVFGLSLSLFDVFHLPVLDFRLAQNAKTHSTPRSQAFLTGLLATLLATPCSGPLLGAVLGYSMTQGIAVLSTVFVAPGLGMASPYLMMAVWPQFSKLLPRPGAWMLVFERLLGFFLLGTSLYLFSLLPQEEYIPALMTLLALAVALWAWGNWGSLKGGTLRRTCVALVCATGVALVGAWAFTPHNTQVEWVPYTPAAFEERLGKENLLLEFTADWCPTCKVLEKTTLQEENMKKLTSMYPLTLMRVDMTREEASSLALLRALESASIPLLGIFPANNPYAPVVLRDAYSFSQLQDAVMFALE